MNISILLAGSVAAYFLIAIYNTFLKEKSMIEEGGDPLPTSSYVFLSLKHLLWVTTILLVGLFVPSEWFSGGAILPPLLVVCYLLLTYILATIQEVLIRTVVIYFRIRSLTKQEKEKSGAE